MDVKYAWFSSAVRAGDDPKSNFKNLGGKLTSNISPREEFFDVPMRRRYSGILEKCSFYPSRREAWCSRKGYETKSSEKYARPGS